MINYAHRGASSYFPENTLSSFSAGLEMGANGLETDVHMTRDGVLVLFHDDTLDRVTDGSGDVSSLSLHELKALRVFSPDRKRTDSIPTLDEFLDVFSAKDIRFAIELKQPGTEKDVIRILDRYDMRSKVTLTSFYFESLRSARVFEPGYRIGYLYGENEAEAKPKMRSLRGEELCPIAHLIRSREDTQLIRSAGFGVRVWGVKDEDTMKRMCRAGVDGMTVNFPDKLTAYLKEAENEI